VLKNHIHNKLAHTAEHAFIGSLQRILGSPLIVRKVEHRENDSSVFIKMSSLNLETVIMAEHEVNSLIYSGRRIMTQHFESLIEARKHFPNLRANEERIKERGNTVRVVEIEGHDVAACAMEHVSNLHECEFFLITRVSKTGRANPEYEIGFVVQNQAKEEAMRLSEKLLYVCQEIGANINTIEDTVKKLNRERKLTILKLKRITTECLANVKHSILEQNGKVNLVQSVLCSLDEGEILDFAGKMIACPEKNTIVLLANLLEESEENAFIVFARSQSLASIDCNRLFNQYSYLGSRGGGKPSFITGVVSRVNVHLLMDNLIKDVRKLLEDSR
jgi:alanyl-tRNA synthetase